MMKRIVAIVGGGPAGMSCAIWLKYFGFYPIIIEKSDRLGGASTINPFHNRWYLGMPGQTGKENAEQFRRHIALEEITTLSGSKLKRIIREEDFRLFTEEHEITAQAIVIATGQRFRGYESIKSIAASQEIELSPRVCFNPGATPATHGKVVAVVGGGDNGIGTAMWLAHTAKQVHLFVRSEMRGFEINQQGILEYVSTGKITLHQPATLDRLELRGDRVHISFEENRSLKQELMVDYIL